MQNYHRHTSYSNIYIADSAAVNEDYAKRAVELGHKVYSSVEHGWAGYYFEAYELAKNTISNLFLVLRLIGSKIDKKKIVQTAILCCWQKREWS